MSRNIKAPKSLFVVTCCILLAVTGFTYFSRPQLPPSIVLNTKGQPTIGYNQARVQVVVFEEPKCSHCRFYNDEIFPQIKKEFIDTNKIRYTIIPVSFLQGSMITGIAALCVYQQNPNYPNDELFIKYIDALYQHENDPHVNVSNMQELINIAHETSPAIDLDRLHDCIAKETYRIQIEKNTAYGAQVMQGRLITPAVYVNGIRVEELSWDNIRKLIQEVLESEGVQ